MYGIVVAASRRGRRPPRQPAKPRDRARSPLVVGGAVDRHPLRAALDVVDAWLRRDVARLGLRRHRLPRVGGFGERVLRNLAQVPSVTSPRATAATCPCRRSTDRSRRASGTGPRAAPPRARWTLLRYSPWPCWRARRSGDITTSSSISVKPASGARGAGRPCVCGHRRPTSPGTWCRRGPCPRSW